MATDELRSAIERVVATLPGGGEARAGQVEMAGAVAHALATKRHLVARAGTGTGKSLAYLVPAVLSDDRVVVGTATKALQDQLAGKDLPQIARGLGRPVRFSVLKGRSNYLCRQRVAEAGEAGAQGRLDEPEAPARRSALADEARAVVAWAAETETGDVAELDFEPDPRVWGSFSVRADECPGAFRCPSGGECFAEAARQRALDAQLVIVNLHLLGAHIASGGAVLPEHDALIVDEAHELEAIMSASLGTAISPGRLRALAGLARPVLGEREGRAVGDQIQEAATRFERALAPLAGKRLRGELDPELSGAVELVGTRLARLESLLRAASDREGTDQAALRSLLSLGALRLQLAGLATPGDDDVVFVDDSDRPSLEIAPIDVAPILRATVFEQFPTVLTSATVPADLAVRLGADPDRVESIDVGSPFDYERQALLYCAAHLPDRRSADAEPALVEEIGALVGASGGRALVLFTSHGVLGRVHAALDGRFDFPLLRQGAEPKRVLLERFASERDSCLFATMGFWQGVDVPGAALSLVIIDRIPFPRPDEPLTAARRDRARAEGFTTVDLARASGLLAQGAGRLIRTASDRGVVAVLDPRLATATYRWTLIRALPPMRRTKNRAEVLAFLSSLREDNPAGPAGDAPSEALTSS